MNDLAEKEITEGKKYIKINIEFFRILIIVVLLVVSIGAGYYYLDFRNNKDNQEAICKTADVKESALSKSAAQLEITSSTSPEVVEILKKVFKHIYLPSGDVRVETIVKPELLRKTNPVFYKYAKAGDKILYYSDRAILYDPAVDKVLDILHIK